MAGTSYTLPAYVTNNAKQDRGIARYFNKANADRMRAATINAGGSGYTSGDVLTLSGGTATTPATFSVTSVQAGAVTGVSLVQGGAYTAHPASNNRATTGGTGTGCVLTIKAFRDIPDLITANGGIVDSAVTSYGEQLEQERGDALRAGLASATETQLSNAAAALGVTLPA